MAQLLEERTESKTLELGDISITRTVTVTPPMNGPWWDTDNRDDQNPWDDSDTTDK